MQSTLIKSCNVKGVEIEIRLSQDKGEDNPDLITQFIYELVNCDND